jgi:hypothetical protein
VLFGLAGCGASSPSAPPPDQAQLAVQSAAQRLEGTWVLVEFQPEKPLEPMLASFLAAQMKELTVSFHGGKMRVAGPGVDAERTYRVTQAAADGFALTVTDPTNVEYRSTGAFLGTDVNFTSLSDPWRGHGRLRRSP